MSKKFNHDWLTQELGYIEARLALIRADRRFWVPNWYKQFLSVKFQERKELLLSSQAIVGEIEQLSSRNNALQHAIVMMTQKIEQHQREIEQNNTNITQKQKQLNGVIMGRRKGAVNRDGSNDMKAGLHSLFMMVVFVVILGLALVFFVLSPFGSKKQNERPSPELNKPAEVIPLDESKNAKNNDFDFYEVLPERKFESSENLSQKQAETPTTELKVDKVEKVEKPVADEVVVEETDDTYDELAEPTVNIQASGVQYLLQVRTYDNAIEADQRRAEVMMAGVDAQVVRKETADQTLYVVMSMPFANKESAKVAYDRLNGSGIDSIVVEQKLQ